MSQDQFWNLIGKKLSGEATADELSELEELIKANPDLLYAAQHIEDLWKLDYPESDPESAYANHLKTLNSKGIPFSDSNLSSSNVHSGRAKRRIILLSSICLTVLFIIGFIIIRLSDNNPDPEKRISE